MARITQEQREGIMSKLYDFFGNDPKGQKMYKENAERRLYKSEDALLDSLERYAPEKLWYHTYNEEIKEGKYDDRLQLKVWLDNSTVRSSLSSNTTKVDLFQLVNNDVHVKKNPPAGKWHGKKIKASRFPMSGIYRGHYLFVDRAVSSIRGIAEEYGCLFCSLCILDTWHQDKHIII